MLKDSARSNSVVLGDLFQQRTLLVCPARTNAKVSYTSQLPLKGDVLVKSDFVTTFFNL